MDFIDTVIGDPHNRNVDWITVHPRTRNTQSTIPIRTDALEILTSKYASTLPILLSGDVFDINSLPFNAGSTPPGLETFTLNDVIARDVINTENINAPSPSNTKLAGFMSARGLLANPALFAGHSHTPWEAVERFMCNVTRAPLPLKLVIHHVQEMCSPGYGQDKHSLLSKKERARFVDIKDIIELVDFLDEKVEDHTGQIGGMRRDL